MIQGTPVGMLPAGSEPGNQAYQDMRLALARVQRDIDSRNN